MNRARAIRQNGVAVNASRHQWRQRAIVRRSTLATSESRAKRASVAPCFRMANQHDDRRDIDAAAEKAQRRRRLAAPAAVDGAAEAEALVVLGAELATAASGLALELGRMQRTVAMPASPGACGVGEIGVEGEQQLVESGIRQQRCVQGSHPSQPEARP